MFDPNPTNRRCFLISTAASGLVLVGCKKTDVEPGPAAILNSRRDVPLRVLLCGNDRWAATMKTAWAGIAEQPLQINVLDPATVSAEAWQAKAIEAMNSCEVAIVPAGLLAAMDNENIIVPFNSDLLGESGLNVDTFFPVLREGLMKHAGRAIAAPLGALQPALVIRTDTEDTDFGSPATWDEYIEAIGKVNGDSKDSLAGEPLADGAAATMFLWRVNASNPPVWLFDRETLSPVIDSETYVAALETMKRCVSMYGKERLTAGEVWLRIATGKLRMAIAWPAVHSKNERIAEATDCQFFPLPRASEKDSTPVQTLVNYDAPVAVISSHCRQSEAAKRLITWLVGGEGTSMIRDAVTGLTELRGDSEPLSRDGENSPLESRSVDQYRTHLSTSLSSLSIRTPLQLLQYRPYAEALDEAVLSCLDDKQPAQEALTQAAKTWAELTEKVGIKSQAKAWRKAQGLSG